MISYIGSGEIFRLSFLDYPLRYVISGLRQTACSDCATCTYTSLAIIKASFIIDLLTRCRLDCSVASLRRTCVDTLYR